jgi:hypothetical protein
MSSKRLPIVQSDNVKRSGWDDRFVTGAVVCPLNGLSGNHKRALFES